MILPNHLHKVTAHSHEWLAMAVPLLAERHILMLGVGTLFFYIIVALFISDRV